MNITLKKMVLAMAITLLFTTVYSQDSKKYKEMAADVEQSMWGTKDPMFETNTIPEKYKNESAVIIAQKYSIATDSKRKTGLFGLPAKNYIDKKIWRNFRQKILINDQASLTDYSEISFEKLDAKRRSSVMGGKDYSFTFLGIRIIKPNGKIENVTVDESAVTVKETKDGKKNKIAIPNLAVGDIIDYYISSYEQVGTGTNTKYASDSPEILTFALTDDYVVLNFNLTIVLDKRVATEYQTINGAPDFKISQKDDDNILELNSSNLIKVKDLIWSVERRQLPMLRVRFVFGELHSNTDFIVKKGEVKKATNAYEQVESEIRKDLTNAFLTIYNNDYDLKILRSYLDETKNRLQKQRPKAVESPDSLAALAYYVARKYVYFDAKFLFSNTDADRGLNLYAQLMQALRMRSVFENALKIDCEFIDVASRYSVNRKSLFELSDLSLLLRINTPKPIYLYIGNALYNYGEYPPSIEGEEGAYFSIKPEKGLLGGVKGYKVEDEGIVKVPLLSKTAHVQNSFLTINLDSADKQLLSVKRKVAATGQLRRYYQASLLSAESIIRDERTYMGLMPDMELEFLTEKEFKKMKPDVVENLKKIRDKQKELEKERFEIEIKNEFDAKPKELKTFATLKTGLRHLNNNVYEMEEEFTIDGWVKKAGNNYIIEAGKFIGTQMEIKQDQRDRKIDVYLPYERTFNHTIEFIVPDGYSAEGLDKFNKKIENEFGGFVSTAVIKDNKVVITASKYYNVPTAKIADFVKIASFIDIAFDYSKEKILLKKK